MIRLHRPLAALVLLVLLAGPGWADFATPFVETGTGVGEREQAPGFVVDLGRGQYLVIVATDTMGYVTIPATAAEGVVPDKLLGRAAQLDAEVTHRVRDRAGILDLRLELHAVTAPPERR